MVNLYDRRDSERGKLVLITGYMAMISKARIRKRMLKQRNEMTKEQVKELSKRITNTVKKIPVYKTSKTVMLYLNFGNEIDSSEIIKDCIDSGKTVVLPFCDPKTMEIIPTRIKDLDLALDTNKMGYSQPRKDMLDPVDTSEIDLIILPGIAFDRKGFRVGFGAGYYDRFLGNLHFEIPTIGLAYDFQIEDSFIKMESYDIPVDYVMTEDRIIVRTD